MKKVIPALLLPSLICFTSTPAQAYCEDSPSFVILSSGECTTMSNSRSAQPVLFPGTPFSVTRLKLKSTEIPGYISVSGQITNYGKEVYRNLLITVRIGESRIEQIFVPGLISPNQTRSFQEYIDKTGTRISTPVSVQKIELL